MGLGVGIAVFVGCFVDDGIGVSVSVGFAVGVEVGTCVAVAVLVGTEDAVEVAAAVGERVTLAVAVGVWGGIVVVVGTAVGVGVEVDVKVAVQKNEPAGPLPVVTPRPMVPRRAITMMETAPSILPRNAWRGGVVLCLASRSLMLLKSWTTDLPLRS